MAEADLDSKIEEAAAWRKAGGRQQYRYPEDIDGPSKVPDPRCHKCGKTAYKAEIVTYEKIPYHKNCFKCLQCKKKLTPGEANPFGEDTFMCNVHFSQALKGTGHADKEAVSASSPSVKATGPSIVGSSGAKVGEDVDLSIGFEFRKAGGRQAYRYPEDIDGPAKRADPRCHKCGKTAYKAEVVTYEKIPYHKNCFKCLQCKKKLTPGESNPWGEDTFLCNTHFHQNVKGTRSVAGEVASASSAEVKATGPSLVSGKTGGFKADVDEMKEAMDFRKSGQQQSYRYPEDIDGPNKRADPRCQKCGKTAYKAEVVTYEKIPYHKKCFRCLQCNKRLTPGTANPLGPDTYMCDTHFQQFVLGGGAEQAASATVSADSEAVEDAGPSVVGGGPKKPKKKTTYKPPPRKRRGKKKD